MDQVSYSFDLLSGLGVDACRRPTAQERFFQERKQTTTLLQRNDLLSREDEETTETQIQIQVSIGYVIEPMGFLGFQNHYLSETVTDWSTHRKQNEESSS